MENRTFSKMYTETGTDLIETESCLRILRGLHIVYLHSDLDKTDKRAEVDIMPDKFRCFADVVLTIFDKNVCLFNQEQMKILIFQQLLKLDVTVRDDGSFKIKLKGYDLEDFKTIVKRFGTEWDSIGPELPFEEDEKINEENKTETVQAEKTEYGFDIFDGDVNA